MVKRKMGEKRLTTNRDDKLKISSDTRLTSSSRK